VVKDGFGEGGIILKLDNFSLKSLNAVCGPKDSFAISWASRLTHLIAFDYLVEHGLIARSFILHSH
jgi:hypothetical protein